MTAIVQIDDCEFAPALLTGADILAMTREGILPEGRGYELIEGVLVEMAAQYSPHVRMVNTLIRRLIRIVPEEFAVSPTPSIFLTGNTMLEPDICLYPDDMESQDVRGGDILLAIEVSDTTLRKDLGMKARLYAEHGVAHYWVIDVPGSVLHRHSDPAGKAYRDVVKSPFDQAVAMPFDKTVSIVLADL